jgi:pyruvate dehydrogenase E2 component (dihydrolipoyllysine-residue acetyltransferase)
MAEKLLMLALSPTMEEGIIVKWRKKEGEQISSGDVLCDVETDKAVMEYQAMNEGTLLKILIAEGGKAAVAEPIGIIGEEGEDVSSLVEETQIAAEEEGKRQKAEGEDKGKRQKAKGKIEEEGGKVRSSPVARRLAQKQGIDLNTIQGSGPKGRIVEKDVKLAIEAQRAAPVPQAPAAGGEETIPVSPKRAIIAKRLSESKFSAPHYYLKVAVEVDGLLAGRKKYNASAPEKLSFNAYLVKFVAEALRRHPMVNATWQGDTIVKHGRMDVALAVAQEDGLITPIVRDCGNKGIIQINRELNLLIEKAKQGTLQPEEYSDSTFTITNLGSYGIEEFTAIINPPNSAILAVGQVLKQPAVNEEGMLCVKSLMKMILSCDHRIIDGVTGGEFLTELKRMLEYPVELLY